MSGHPENQRTAYSKRHSEVSPNHSSNSYMFQGGKLTPSNIRQSHNMSPQQERTGGSSEFTYNYNGKTRNRDPIKTSSEFYSGQKKRFTSEERDLLSQYQSNNQKIIQAMKKSKDERRSNSALRNNSIIRNRLERDLNLSADHHPLQSSSQDFVDMNPKISNKGPLIRGGKFAMLSPDNINQQYPNSGLNQSGHSTSSNMPQLNNSGGTSNLNSSASTGTSGMGADQSVKLVNSANYAELNSNRYSSSGGKAVVIKNKMNNAQMRLEPKESQLRQYMRNSASDSQNEPVQFAKRDFTPILSRERERELTPIREQNNRYQRDVTPEATRDMLPRASGHSESKNSSSTEGQQQQRERKLATGDERKKRMDALEKYVETNYGSNGGSSGGQRPSHDRQPQQVISQSKSKKGMEDSAHESEKGSRVQTRNSEYSEAQGGQTANQNFRKNIYASKGLTTNASMPTQQDTQAGIETQASTSQQQQQQQQQQQVKKKEAPKAGASTQLKLNQSFEKELEMLQGDHLEVEEMHYFFVNFHQKSKLLMSKMK